MLPCKWHFTFTENPQSHTDKLFSYMKVHYTLVQCICVLVIPWQNWKYQPWLEIQCYNKLTVFKADLYVDKQIWWGAWFQPNRICKTSISGEHASSQTLLSVSCFSTSFSTYCYSFLWRNVFSVGRDFLISAFQETCCDFDCSLLLFSPRMWQAFCKVDVHVIFLYCTWSMN